MVSPSDHDPIPADDPRATDEVLKLVGLFFVNFSQYTWNLEQGISRCIGIGDARINRTMWALTSGMEERGLRKAFFAATVLVGEPTELETRSGGR